MFKVWKKRRDCFHQDRNARDPEGNRITETWIREQIIDGGRKMYWCNECTRTWFK